jgi:hypothetical protein
LQSSPDRRVDWFAGGIVELVENQEVPRLLARLPLFIDSMRRWLQTACPATNRLAFGAVLNLDVGSREEGYRTLSNYLDFDLSPGSYDFLYQINRKRTSAAVERWGINRLTKWSVEVRERRTLTIHLAAGSVESTEARAEWHCRLELDINTIPGPGGPLPHDRLGALLEEMQGLSLEIVREGDIP